MHAWASYYNHNVCMLLTTHKHTEPLHVYSIYLFSCFEFYVSFLCHNAILRNLKFHSQFFSPKKWICLYYSLAWCHFSKFDPRMTSDHSDLWPPLPTQAQTKQDIYLNDDFQTCFIKKLRHMQQRCSYQFVMWQKHKIQ